MAPPVRRRRECRDVPLRPRGTAAAGRDLAAAAPGGGGVEGRGLPTAELQRGAFGDGKTAFVFLEHVGKLFIDFFRCIIDVVNSQKVEG